MSSTGTLNQTTLNSLKLKDLELARILAKWVLHQNSIHFIFQHPLRKIIYVICVPWD